MSSLASGLDSVDLDFLGFPGIIATGVLHDAGGVALVDPGDLPLLDALRRALPGPLPCYVTPRATLEG